MKTTFVKAMFILCGLAATTAAVQAESISVKVPFAFAAGGKTLPPGEYTMETSGNMLMIRSASAPPVIVRVVPDSWTNPVKPSATFERADTMPMLEGVNLPTGIAYAILPSSRSALSAAPLSAPAALARH